MSKRGFTLTELLISISIITLLSAAGLFGYTALINRAKYARARKEIRLLASLVNDARTESNQTFFEIIKTLPVTYPGCVECPCRGLTNIRRTIENDPNHPCLADYTLVMEKLIELAKFDAINTPIKDPWGAPYLFNENEGEGGGCYTDNIHSAGANSTTPNWRFIGGAQLYEEDDLNLNIPVLRCTPLHDPPYHHPDQNME